MTRKIAVIEDGRSENACFEPVRDTLHMQSVSPPGGDISIGSCYDAMIHLPPPLNTTFNQIVTEVMRTREITPGHFVNLLFRAIQFLEMREHRLDYRHFTHAQEWQNELIYIMGEHEQELIQLLIERDTTTTIYQRYAGIQALLTKRYKGASFSIADFGCGGNLGLPGIAGGVPFEPIEDHTPDEITVCTPVTPLLITAGYAVDRYDPHDPDNVTWRQACSYYPQEFQNIDRRIEAERIILEQNHIQFIGGDIVTGQTPTGGDICALIPPESLDVVIFSTVLYQLSPSDRYRALSLALGLLNQYGCIFVQDFAVKDEQEAYGIACHSDWGQDGAYRLFQIEKANPTALELLRWQNGRCKKVCPGEDYPNI